MPWSKGKYNEYARKRAVKSRSANKVLPEKLPFKIWKVRQIQDIPAGPRLVQVIEGMIP